LEEECVTETIRTRWRGAVKYNYKVVWWRPPQGVVWWRPPQGGCSGARRAREA
jgi:hypothetical protein